MSKITDMTKTHNWSGQKLVTADHLLFEAPREKHFMTGSEVLKEAVKRCTVDASVSYPITPQSEAAHLIGELWAEGYVGVYFRAILTSFFLVVQVLLYLHYKEQYNSLDPYRLYHQRCFGL